MPPYSFGMCGSQRPRSLAAPRISMMALIQSSRLQSFSVGLAFDGADHFVEERADLEPDLVDFGRKREVDGHADQSTPT